MSTAALSTRGLDKSFGSLVVAKDIELDLPRGARYALIGPERRRQDHADQPDHRHAQAGRRPHLSRKRTRSPRSGPRSASSAVWCAPSRSTRLFPHLSALEAVTLAVCERRGYAGTWWQKLPAYPDAIEEAYAILLSLRLGASCYRPTRELAYGQQRLLEIALALATKPEGAAARRAGRRRARRARAPSCSR